MFVSISTDHWTVDAGIHEGVWKKCAYSTNISMSYENKTSMINATCCSSRQFQGYIGAVGFFFIAQLVFDVIIIGYTIGFSTGCLCDINKKTFAVSSSIHFFVSVILLLIVVSVYGGINADPTTLGLSYFILLGVFVFRILENDNRSTVSIFLLDPRLSSFMSGDLTFKLTSKMKR
ncbi:uncharacterized protein LOC134700286 [Mytilus trossulus]|uniref:uncharacterized protein LOC134700286 n=1 Tax=Mytilus trossulus TaxID=6551 RepID=UPI0030054B43